MKLNSAKLNSMKLNIKSLLRDKNVLYVVLFLAIANLFAYLMFRQFEAILFFLIVGFASSYFSKNMIIIMLIAMISTNLLIGTKLLGTAVKEGLEGMNKDATGATDATDASGNKIAGTDVASVVAKMTTDMAAAAAAGPSAAGPSAAAVAVAPAKPTTAKTSEKFSTLSPASVRDGEFIDTKVDYASTLESAYDNLDKLLGSDAIRSMTEDTQRLAEKQKLLMNNIKQLQPMMQTAGKMLDGLNVGQMGDMLNGLEEKFKKFTGGASPMKV